MNQLINNKSLKTLLLLQVITVVVLLLSLGFVIKQQRELNLLRNYMIVVNENVKEVSSKIDDIESNVDDLGIKIEEMDNSLSNKINHVSALLIMYGN